MHKFLRAIGFSNIRKKDMEIILDEIIEHPEMMKITKDSEGNEFAELSRSFASNIGITVRGNYQDDDSFKMEYYYPYLLGTRISTNEQIEVEKHAEKESFRLSPKTRYESSGTSNENGPVARTQSSLR